MTEEERKRLSKLVEQAIGKTSDNGCLRDSFLKNHQIYLDDLITIRDDDELKMVVSNLIEMSENLPVENNAYNIRLIINNPKLSNMLEEIIRIMSPQDFQNCEKLMTDDKTSKLEPKILESFILLKYKGILFPPEQKKCKELVSNGYSGTMAFIRTYLERVGLDFEKFSALFDKISSNVLQQKALANCIVFCYSNYDINSPDIFYDINFPSSFSDHDLIKIESLIKDFPRPQLNESDRLKNYQKFNNDSAQFFISELKKRLFEINSQHIGSQNSKPKI